MTSANETRSLTIYVWEGEDELANRVERAFADGGVSVIRADHLAVLPCCDPSRISFAVISTSVIDSSTAALSECHQAAVMPVIWVGTVLHVEHYSQTPYGLHVLPVDFTCESLRDMVAMLLRSLHGSFEEPPTNGEPVSQAGCMQALLREVDLFADCDMSVLICGETGVGKEGIAQQLHRKHARYGRGSFVPVNCGAIPDGLFESQFFGHAKGAFTGAVGAHKGYFEQADGGTLFLDEIGDLPLHQQVKLLRVLQDGSVTRIGTSMPVKLDFRLVAATNKNLPRLVSQGRFRMDLFYRLAVILLRVPTLDERGTQDKIAIFGSVIRSVVGDEFRRTYSDVPPWLAAAIAEMRFPGNIRELRNLAERIGVTVRQMKRWDERQLRILLAHAQRTQRELAQHTCQSPDNRWQQNAADRTRVLNALTLKGWHRRETADYLGISRKVLWEKMKRYQISDA